MKSSLDTSSSLSEGICLFDTSVVLQVAFLRLASLCQASRMLLRRTGMFILTRPTFREC